MVNISLLRNTLNISMYIFSKLELHYLGNCYNCVIAQLFGGFTHYFHPTDLYFVPILYARHSSNFGINDEERSRFILFVVSFFEPQFPSV